MGIDYSITVGYGFAVAKKSLPEKLKGMYLEQIEEWLDDNGHDQTRLEECGNFYSEDTYFFFYGPGTETRTEYQDFGGMLDLSASVNAGAQHHLEVLAGALGIRHERIGWKVFGNVT